MPIIDSKPILTNTYNSVEDFLPESNSIYIFGDGGIDEFRAQHISNWDLTNRNIQLFAITEETITSFKYNDIEFLLKSPKSLNLIWNGVDKNTNIYIDITGLTHPVWAAIIRSSIDNGFLKTLVVYVEPDIYSRSKAPIEGQVYDLSEKIKGISPLPGFTVLSQIQNQDYIFVAFLGFEGPRLRHIVENLQPSDDSIFPVIGLPGFKSWYVFETFKGNKGTLEEKKAWQTIRYVPADCPFSCYYLLEELYDYSDHKMKIAPIGTKPHALGSIMFSINHPDVEIIYDHPIRKPGRTIGSSKLHVYHISAILKPNIAQNNLIDARKKILDRRKKV